MENKKSFGLLAVAAMTTFTFAFTTPNAKQEKTYTIDTKKTSASWLATKVTGKHNGSVTIANGKITSDGKNISGVKVEFDMTTITVADLTDKEWNDKLVGHLKSDDFFSVAKHPKATFEMTKATLKANNEYTITGKLTIKGITNEISFPAMIKFNDKTMVTVAKITVNRTKYDIKYGSASYFDQIGDKAISDNFELEINVIAEVAAI